MFFAGMMKRAWAGMCCSLRLWTAVLGVLACTWWAVLYPQLYFADGTYVAVGDGDGKEASAEGESDEAGGILRASGDEIVIGSRLLEWLGQKIERR